MRLVHCLHFPDDETKAERSNNCLKVTWVNFLQPFYSNLSPQSYLFCLYNNRYLQLWPGIICKCNLLCFYFKIPGIGILSASDTFIQIKIGFPEWPIFREFWIAEALTVLCSFLLNFSNWEFYKLLAIELQVKFLWNAIKYSGYKFWVLHKFYLLPFPHKHQF